MRWLQIFGETAGAEELASLLAEQGLDEEPLYAAVLLLVELR